MGCKTKLKVNDHIKSREAWSDLSIATGYYLERGERSLTGLTEKVRQHFPDVDESHVAMAAKEVLSEIYQRVPSVTNKKATLQTLRAEVAKLTEPTAIQNAKTAIQKLESEDTRGFTKEQWQARYKEIIDEARVLNRGAKIDENFYIERESAYSDPEVRKLRQRLNTVKKEADTFIQQAEKSSRTINKRFWLGVADAMSAVKSIKSSTDISAPGRQGILLIYANPAKSKAAFRDQFRAINKAGSEAARMELQEHPRYAEVVSDGVLAIGGVEEAFPSDLAAKLPVVGQSSDMYSAFQHRQRMDFYDYFAAMTENREGRDLTQKERKALANFVNVATGRGSVKGLDADGMDMANKLMFSIRLASSRIQYLAGAPIWNPDASPAVKKTIATAYGQTAVGLGSTVFLLSQLGLRLNTEDPNEHNFLKTTLGGTDFDISGGLTRYIVLASRMTTTKTNSHQKQAQLMRFLRGLASPVAGMAHDVVVNNGKYYFKRSADGKQVLIWDDTNDETRMKSAQRLAIEMLAPIGVGNVIEATEKGRPAEEITRNALVEALGIGVTNREDQRK